MSACGATRHPRLETGGNTSLACIVNVPIRTKDFFVCDSTKSTERGVVARMQKKHFHSYAQSQEKLCPWVHTQ